MKIATYNVNGIGKRFGPLAAWLEDARPDAVCLQELKTTQETFPAGKLKDLGYEAVWLGQRSWNGVAILARGQTPIPTSRSLPGDDGDRQSRYIEAAVGGILIGCIYLPNGNPRPGPKFDYKNAWFERLLARARYLQTAGIPAVLAGDFNVVPTEFDIYERHSYADNALLQPEPRKAYAQLMKLGWTDAIRSLHPRDPKFSYWSYMRDRWRRDAGLRLDFLLLSSVCGKRLIAGDVDRWVRGLPEASDVGPPNGASFSKSQLASFTSARAALRRSSLLAFRIRRRAAMRSRTSCCFRECGKAGSDVRHSRPRTTK